MRTAMFALVTVTVSVLSAGCSGDPGWLTAPGTEESFGPYRFTAPSGFNSKPTPNAPPEVTSRVWLGPKDPPSEPMIRVTFMRHGLDLSEVEPDWEAAVSETLRPMRQKCSSASTEPTRRLRLNGMEAIRGGLTGQLKDVGDFQFVIYVAVDNENLVSLIAADGGPDAERSIERLEESLLTFQRPGYEAPPSIAAIREQPDEQTSLVEARRGFTTKLVPSALENMPLEEPPGEVFRKVEYDSPVGKLAAYLTPDPGDGQRHSAIVWITGGDCNSIGDVWTEQSADNEQSASAYRKAGIVMMFPSLRGGNQNPGSREGFFGEVDDVLAAAEYLAEQSCVDPKRIYLGGHSSGGTLALLVAECSDRFRAVFSFGPTDELAGYPRQYLPFDVTSAREMELRAPVLWLHSIKSPTFVFEGTGGNLDSLKKMQSVSKNDRVRFFTLEDEDHFTILAPVNRLIAGKILEDEGLSCKVSFTDGELADQFASRHSGGLAGPPSFPGPGSFPGPHAPPGSGPSWDGPLPPGVPPEVREQYERIRREHAQAEAGRAAEEVARAAREDPMHADYFQANLNALRSRDVFERDEALDRLIGSEPKDVADENLRAQIARAIRDVAFDRGASPHTRDKAIRGLITWGSTYSVPLLLKLLEEDSPFVQKEVVAALAELGDERAIEPLAERFAADRFGGQEFAEALRAFGPRAEDAVLKHATTDNPIKARRTLELLSQIGTSKSLRYLSRLRRDRQLAFMLGNEIQAATAAIQQRARETKRNPR